MQREILLHFIFRDLNTKWTWLAKHLLINLILNKHLTKAFADFIFSTLKRIYIVTYVKGKNQNQISIVNRTLCGLVK